MATPTRDRPGQDILALLRAAGLGRHGDESFELVPVQGGRNNRVYRLDLPGNPHPCLVKSYFRHPEDPRDRLAAEFDFLWHAWTHGVKRIPRPIARRPELGLALYQFLPGRPMASGDVNAPAVAYVLELIRQLIAVARPMGDTARVSPGMVIGPASEACFSIEEHLSTIDRRVRRLGRIPDAKAVERDALDFARQRLAGAWESAVRQARDHAGAAGLDAARPLDPRHRILSPSDLGFHNALLDDPDPLQRPPVIRFVDFEYAGWDDPAKLACDFAYQPAVPLPAELWGGFADTLCALCSEDRGLRARIAALLPAYRVKWCCILLNEFLPADAARRRHAGAGDSDDRKRAQLRRAADLIGRAA